MTASTGPETQTILVVEPDVLVRLTIADYLRNCGFKIIEASNGNDALRVLERAEIPVDVLFSDVEMPGGMDGFALSSWIRDHRPKVRVVLTGTVSRAATSAARLCHDGLVKKPYEPQVVLDRIHRLTSRADESQERHPPC